MEHWVELVKVNKSGVMIMLFRKRQITPIRKIGPYSFFNASYPYDLLHPFHATDLFLYPRNQRFSDVFRGYRNYQWYEIGCK